MNSRSSGSAASAAALPASNAGGLCRAVITVPEEMELADASRLMRDRQARYLLVTNASVPAVHQIVGIASAHEIDKFLVARVGASRELTVADVMTRPALVLNAREAVAGLRSLLQEVGTSCAPVLSDEGEIIGMLCAEDLRDAQPVNV